MAAREAIGTPGLIIMTVAAVFATAAAINSTLFSSSNLSKRVADDKELPGIFQKTRNNVPYAAVILLGVLSTILAVIGKLSSLVEAASLIFLITFGTVNIIALNYVQKKWKWFAWLGIIMTGIVLIVLIARLVTVAPVQLGILIFLALLIIIGRPAMVKSFSKNDSDDQSEKKNLKMKISSPVNALLFLMIELTVALGYSQNKTEIRVFNAMNSSASVEIQADKASSKSLNIGSEIETDFQQLHPAKYQFRVHSNSKNLLQKELALAKTRPIQLLSSENRNFLRK